MADATRSGDVRRQRYDPVGEEVFRHLLISVAEEMGVTLERTAYSPNIKERLDHSCALFDRHGALVAQAAHIPVHLGAFPLLMRRVVPGRKWRRGDVLICNDPYVGGTHLPDISLISPVFYGRRLVGFVANRAHHADVGGAFPGSMAPTTEIYQEGIILPPLWLYRGGKRMDEVFELLLRNVRTPGERRGDLEAQVAANATGAARMTSLVERYGMRELEQHFRAARNRATRAMEVVLAAIPDGEYVFEDVLDGDGHGDAPLPITVKVTVHGRTAAVDFAGTAPQALGSVNATLAVCHAAVYYCFICLLEPEAPLNEGTFAPIHIRAPEGSLVCAAPPAAVAAGNVETSQRIVDAVLGALAQAVPHLIPAASQGTMNNLTLGGVDAAGRPWAYYETLGGGGGGGPQGPGLSGLHCHMSNTRNTPVEALEYHYPLRVHRYALREGSGGAGRHPGGEGVIRELEVLGPATVTLLTDRRRRSPYGLEGGGPGSPGRNLLAEPGEETWRELPDKGSRRLAPGARIRLETPGGGGWGSAAKKETAG